MNENVKLIKGDCFKFISQLEDNSIDLVITDPPLRNRFNTTTRKWKI